MRCRSDISLRFGSTMHGGCRFRKVGISPAVVLCTVLIGAAFLTGCGRNSTSDVAQSVDQAESDTGASPSNPKGEVPSRGGRLPGTPSGESTFSAEDGRPGAIASDRATPTVSPQPIFRPDDDRPQHDDARLARLGIFRYESKRLKLYTDIDPKIAETLPPIIDHAYEVWVDYFGPLPPARDGSEYQVTGYLMADKALFRETGLLPADLPGFHHGRHKGARFWMNDQEYNYFRRHLLIHEATHCFMTMMPDVRAPVWYLEGMAELFGTHHIDVDGGVNFRVLPFDREIFAGHGRITIIRDAVQSRQAKSLREVMGLEINEFLEPEAYAWSWALCKFLDTHPRYRDRFRRLENHMVGDQFIKTFNEYFHDDFRELETEWLLFVANLQYGYDIERTAIEFHPGKPLPQGESERVEIFADRGWQSSRVRVEKERQYVVEASGRFTLAQTPKPWISEPQGISFRYFEGRPLGLLLAAIHPDPSTDYPQAMLQIIPIGRADRFTAHATGTLYFRLNDSDSELSDNTGAVDVQIRGAEPSP